MLSPAEEKRLSEKARQLRRDLLTMIHQAGDGHPGPALSITDLVTVLYYRIMRIDPGKPGWPDRDRFILSKGHACAILYATLADLGYFSRELLPGFRSIGSILQGHPDMNKTPGIDMTTGTLGHGLPTGAGMAAAGRLADKTYYVYVVVGDGELNEGIVWEAAMSAAHMKLGNLIAFIDNNNWQSGGTIETVSGLTGIADRFRSFGWHTLEINGHDLNAIADSVDAAKAEKNRPTVIVAHTLKGKGVPFMENNNAWHKGVPNTDELALALAALGEDQ